jgi:hypothetical protein
MPKPGNSRETIKPTAAIWLGGGTVLAAPDVRLLFLARMRNVVPVVSCVGGPAEFLVALGWCLPKEPCLARTSLELAGFSCAAVLMPHKEKKVSGAG